MGKVMGGVGTKTKAELGMRYTLNVKNYELV